MINLTHEWDFDTASRFLQSLAKSAAWRAAHNLSYLGLNMSAYNGGLDTVRVEISFTP